MMFLTNPTWTSAVRRSSLTDALLYSSLRHTLPKQLGPQGSAAARIKIQHCYAMLVNYDTLWSLEGAALTPSTLTGECVLFVCCRYVAMLGS